MGRYTGETFNIPLGQSGFCHNKNVDIIAPTVMVHPSRNVVLNEGGIRKRGGTARVDTATMGAVKVSGLFGYTLANGNQFIVRATSDGYIWKDVANKLSLYKVGDVGFNGTGLNDMTADNSYGAGSARSMYIQIDGVNGAKEFVLTKDKDRLRDSIIDATTGRIRTTTLNAGGTGYEVGDLFTIDGGTTAAHGKVITVSAGVVGTFEITSDGAGYAVANGIGTTKTESDAGTGLVVNITAIQTGGGIGYAVNDTITLDGPTEDNDLAIGKITGVSSGVVTSYSFSYLGSGYSEKEAVETTATSGSGTGFRIDITEVHGPGGKNYIEDETFELNAGTTHPTGKVLTVGDDGEIETFEILTVGAGCSVEDDIMLCNASGSGTYASMNIEELCDTFRWRKQMTPTTWDAEHIPITGEYQTLDPDEENPTYDYKVIFTDIVGHTCGDYWHTDIALTDWTANKIVQITQSEDNLIMCNSADRPVTWNGTDAFVSNFINIPTDWAGTNFPRQVVLHGRGNSQRGWALGCPDNPQTIYASLNGEVTNFDNDTVLLFQVETNDGFGIVGGVEFGNRLVLFGKTRSFIMEDGDTDTDNWGYTASQWHGGVAHHRLIVKTPNDVVCMMENGEIYSVTAAETYGDYKAASLSRPSFMHEWIKKYISLTHIAQFHAIYDPVLRAILFFVVQSGSSTIDTALVYFVDRPPEIAWTILCNDNFESGYSAYSSALVRASAGNWKIYTGSYAGRVWKLNEVNRNDNANAFISRYKTPTMAFDNVRESKRYDHIKIVSVTEGLCDIGLTWWIDGQGAGSEDISFASSGDVLGSFVLGTSILGGKNILETSIKIGALGKRLQLEAKNSTANEDFFLSQFLIDFIPLGKKV